MKLFFWKDYRGLNNFGDEINPWLWKKFMPGVLNNNDSTLFLGIGTILNAKHLPQASRKVVFSSGVGYGTVPVIDNNWKIYCVRGPLTAKVLKISKDLALTDGALLIKKYYKPNGSKKHHVSLMPHFKQAVEGGNSLKNICDSLSFYYIDPQWPVEKVLQAITETELLITEAMHGAIMADAFRVPWVTIKSTDNICEFKWIDWCASMNLNYAPEQVMPLWNLPQNAGAINKLRSSLKQRIVKKQLSRIVKKVNPSLSKTGLVEKRVAQLDEKCEQFKRDVRRGVFNDRLC